MPANSLKRISKKGSVSHIYNKGIENKKIFNDKQDYDSFLSFIKEYLNEPNDPKTVKKTFTIDGKTYQGTPHQPKNYHGKVELIAYRLEPTRFDLVIHQLSDESPERFLRSLGTRYSMYFNKKYGRSGSLFQGPYRSVNLTDRNQILKVSKDLHAKSMEGINSFDIYSGEDKSTWLNRDLILAAYVSEKSIDTNLPESYKSFVFEKPNTNEVEPILERINETQMFMPAVNKIPSSLAQKESTQIKNRSKPYKKATARIPEFFAIVGIFIILVSLGIRNIQASTIKVIQPSPSPVVLATEITTDIPTPTPAPVATEEPKTEVLEVKEPSKFIVVKTKDGSPTINIRQRPTIYSETIGKAKNDDRFEVVSENLEWYEVKIDETTTGYVVKRYVYIDQTTN